MNGQTSLTGFPKQERAKGTSEGAVANFDRELGRPEAIYWFGWVAGKLGKAKGCDGAKGRERETKR